VIESNVATLETKLIEKTEDISRLKNINENLRNQVEELPRLREQVNEKGDKIKGKEIENQINSIRARINCCHIEDTKFRTWSGHTAEKRSFQ